MIYTEKPSMEELQKHFELIRASGEPGLLHHAEMQRRNPHAKGTNPCFSGHMRLLTTEGYKTFRELEGKTFDIVSYDGTTSEGKVWSNGIKNTIELRLSGGKTIICTPDHRFMLADGSEIEAQHTAGEYIKAFEGEPLMVLSTSPHSIEEVFDFHEPNNHWGVVEGLVAHNCGEILLDDRQTCNLTEINMSAFVREDGSVDMERMLHAQRLSAKIGYRMATIELELHEWDKAGKKDMLTGCSLSGMADFLNKTQMSNDDFAAVLRKLRKVAREEVDEMAEKLKMGKTLLVTSIKPAGTLSLLPGISAGIHFQHSDYYIRRVRVNEADPLSRAMTEMGFASVPENGQTEENCSTRVFAFPMKSPKGATKFDVGAIRQLELYKLVMENYVEHNTSNTISVRPEEWDKVVDWVYKNWDSVVGMTFLELTSDYYLLAPYESITEEQYHILLESTPSFDAKTANEIEDFSDLLAADIEECSSGYCPVR